MAYGMPQRFQGVAGPRQQQPWWAQSQMLSASQPRMEQPPPQSGGGMPGPPPMQGGGMMPYQRNYGGFGRFGERTPGTPYTWEDLSAPADPQWLSGYLRDYANKLGYFGDPRDSALSDFARQQAAQTSGALQRRYQTAGQVSGLPAGQRGYAWLQGMLGGQGSEAAIINQLLRQQFEEQQGWARNLAAGFAGIQDTRPQTRAMEQAWMGPAGSVLGSGVGAMFGGGR